MIFMTYFSKKYSWFPLVVLYFGIAIAWMVANSSPGVDRIGSTMFHLSRETQMAVTEAKVQLQAIGVNPSATWGTPLGPLGRAGAKNTNVHIQLQ
jgi:hypothetical protein